MITIVKDSLRACCPEMFDGIIRGVFIVIRAHDSNKRWLVFSDDSLFYTDIRFCPYCGEETEFEYAEEKTHADR